jgi:hypothetical protein
MENADMNLHFPLSDLGKIWYNDSRHTAAAVDP